MDGRRGENRGLIRRCLPDPSRVDDKGLLLNIHLGLTPIISLLAGILILMMPKLLNYIIAFYLIAIGLIGLLGLHQLHMG
jgi:hypothetical protein